LLTSLTIIPQPECEASEGKGCIIIWSSLNPQRLEQCPRPSRDSVPRENEWMNKQMILWNNSSSFLFAVNSHWSRPWRLSWGVLSSAPSTLTWELLSFLGWNLK
jgi:hypothetical protein